MRGTWIAVVSLGLGLAPVHFAQAGLYHPEQPLPWPIPAKFPIFQNTLTELRSAADKEAAEKAWQDAYQRLDGLLESLGVLQNNTSDSTQRELCKQLAEVLDSFKSLASSSELPKSLEEAAERGQPEWYKKLVESIGTLTKLLDSPAFESQEPQTRERLSQLWKLFESMLPRARYLAFMSKLEAKERTGTLTLMDRINLSACYVRLSKPEQAVQVLQAIPEAQRNFLALANLATAHQLAGRPERAIALLEQALAVWPVTYAGFTPRQLREYRWAERYHLVLLRLRQRDSLRQPGNEPETLDALFPKVRFVGVGADDRYVAGELAPKQWDELPQDPLAIVKHLVLWLPLDNRLYWLLGEMFNAEGDVPAARVILNELVDKGRMSNAGTLRQHRQVLMEAQWVEPNVAAAPQSVPGKENPQQAGTQVTWLPDWRQVGAGFVAGLLVAFIGSLQFHEYRRRRQQKET